MNTDDDPKAGGDAGLKCISPRDFTPLNGFAPRSVTVLGIVTENKAAMYVKAEYPNVVAPSGMDRNVSDYKLLPIALVMHVRHNDFKP